MIPAETGSPDIRVPEFLLRGLAERPALAYLQAVGSTPVHRLPIPEIQISSET
jgi:hypothetical protein